MAKKQEIELKLLVSRSTLVRLARWTPPEGWVISPLRQRQLSAVYYDTPDCRLQRKGFALRVRRSRKTLKRTIKFGRAIENGLSQPSEYEDIVDSLAPAIETITDRKLKSRILRALDGAEPEVIFENRIRRNSRIVEVPDCGIVELAMDNGEVYTPNARTTVTELEIELQSGEPYVILSVAEALMYGVTFAPSATSKAGTGYALLAENSENTADRTNLVTQPAGISPAKPKLNDRMTGAEGLGEIGRTAAQQIIMAMNGCLETDDAEQPHRLRVGLRRLRTALRLFRPFAGTPAMRGLADDARDLGRIVGDVRDADVLIDDVIAPAARASAITRDAEWGLISVVDAHRLRKRLAMRKSLRGTRWNTLRLNAFLFDYAVARANAEAANELAETELSRIAPKMLAKCWRRVRKWGDAIDRLDVEERHEMRKAMKELRYATEFFAPLLPGSGAFLKRLKRLQDIFGYLNDVTLTGRLEQIVRASARRRPQPDGFEPAAMKRATKEIHQWHIERADAAWHDAKHRWIELCANTPDWLQAGGVR
ncbi:MAG: CHAD domain-containing protein [Hyphomicrobiaceae bacterium]|nr:CHAD domain-containing protein [Hyphomicrobiaceae bacterium]